MKMNTEGYLRRLVFQSKKPVQRRHQYTREGFENFMQFIKELKKRDKMKERENTI